MAELTIQQAFDIALEHHRAGRLQEAEPIYRQILARQPEHATATHHLGLIALQVGRKLIAVNLIRRSIVLDPHCAEAHNNLGNALGDLDQPDEAMASYRRAIAIKPDFAAAHSNLGAALKDRGQLGDAITSYKLALSYRPDLTEAHYNLGDALTALGQYDEAVESYRRSLEIAPGYAEAYNNMGHALHRAGRLDEAVTAIGQALSIRPNFPEAHCNLGNALSDQGKNDEAMDAYNKALQDRPDYAEAHQNLGNALVAKGQIDAAIASFEHAILIRPNFAEAFSNLGSAYAKQNKREEAISAYRQAVELKPGFFEAHYNLGNALIEAGRLREAITACRNAVAINPNHPDAHNSLGNALKLDWQLEAAQAAYRRAVEIRPGFADALNGLANVLKDCGQIDESIAIYRQAVDLNPASADFHSNLVLALHYQPSGAPAEIAMEEARWNNRHAEPLQTHIRHHKNDRNPDRRLRIGYVSPDFQKHAVGQNLVPLFQNHDHQPFEINCYSLVTRPDEMTHQFKQLADRWRDISGMDDESVAQQIGLDEIDILVDLTLHTAGNRLRVFARKPAPVQVTFAGYPGSTGLTAIDYRLSDPYLDPPGADESFYSEETIRLPNSFWCYDPLEHRDIAVNLLPALSTGVVTFGCLNNFCKINNSTLSLWAQVLRQVKDSRLLLLASEGSHRQNALDQFARQGINPERIEFSPRLSRQKYLDLYHQIDLGLDSFPYNGHTTSLDSLWMGVPVVTVAGQTPVSRAGFCQLSNLGLAELAGDTPERFVQLAVDLALDLPRLSALRSTLRHRMEQSPLMDAQRFAQDIEAAYRKMWRTWCAGKFPSVSDGLFSRKEF